MPKHCEGTSMTVEIHNITFSGDLRLFELQALSIDKFFDHGSITKYRIIVNDSNENELIKSINSFLTKHISLALRQKIEIVSSSKFILPGKDGWKDQQYLKLFSVADSQADWVIVLDSKNHFVKETLLTDFFIGNKAKTYFGHPAPALEPWLFKSNEFFSVDNYQQNAMPTVTPYPMRPDLTRLMLNRIKSDSRIEDKDHLSSSKTLDKTSEFFLYFAFLQKLGCILDYYEAAPRMCETLYTVWPQDQDVVEKFLNALRDGKYFVFGLHRKRLPQLSDSQKQIISDIWKPLRLPEPDDYYLKLI
jgi:hypothetical protein